MYTHVSLSVHIYIYTHVSVYDASIYIYIFLYISIYLYVCTFVYWGLVFGISVNTIKHHLFLFNQFGMNKPIY